MTSLSRPKKRKVDLECRAFNDSWTEQFFFVPMGGKSVCLICSDNVAVNKEYNLKRHYDSKHSAKYNNLTEAERKDKVAELQRQRKKQQTMFTKARTTNERAVRASYAVSEILAKRMKPFQDGELIKECINTVVGIMCPKEKTSMDLVSLSRRTVTNRIELLSEDIKTSLRDRIGRFAAYSLAMDESADVKDTAQIAIFVRGVNNEFDLTEEFVGLVGLKNSTTGEDIFEAVTKTMNEYGLEFHNLVGVTTDGAPAMIGKNVGCVSLLRKRKVELGHGELISCHCIIHQENLCAKVLRMPHVMSVVVATVNFIRSRGFNHRQFQSFLQNLNSEYGDVLYFSEVRWLSRGSMLERFFALRDEIAVFMNDKQKPVTELNDKKWICDLAFLVDITKHINDLNMKLQGNDQHIGLLYSHIRAFETKLRLWATHLQIQNLDHFPVLASVEPSLPDTNGYSEKINELREEFANRFSDFRQYKTEISIFASPFDVDVEMAPSELQMELIDFQCGLNMKAKFHENGVLDFYAKYLEPEKYPLLRKHALKMAALFGSTYLCEQTFSRMKFTKSKCRSSLTDEHLESTLRLSTTNLKSNMDRVLNVHQQYQASH